MRNHNAGQRGPGTLAPRDNKRISQTFFSLAAPKNSRLTRSPPPSPQHPSPLLLPVAHTPTLFPCCPSSISGPSEFHSDTLYVNVHVCHPCSFFHSAIPLFHSCQMALILSEMHESVTSFATFIQRTLVYIHWVSLEKLRCYLLHLIPWLSSIKMCLSFSL